MEVQFTVLQKNLFTIFLILSTFAAYAQSATMAGEAKANHKLTLTWNGPRLEESASTFKDYRLDVTFTSPTNKVYRVPGYFAADGRAGESGAGGGNKWRVHFTPLETGKWKYEASFRTGPRIAADLSPTAGSAASFDGDTGSFNVAETDKSGTDFRGKGKLQYVEEPFLQFSDGDYFLKIGANSPEVFLEYAGFDGTNTSRTYPGHISDWKSGEPGWKDGKGKGIIGVVNYLAGQGLNSHYFLLMNAYGDGKETFPWTGADNYYEYDVSKLDQWQVVFDHMMKKGIMPQFVLTEQENQSYFEHKEGGTFADSRKIFYREMVARFGYLNALTWNIGEESGWQKDETYGKAISNAQRKEFADYLQRLLYYRDHVVVHNGPSDTDAIFSGLVGEGAYTGLSYQGNFEDPYYGHERIAYWRNQADSSGQPWVISYDEPYTNPEMPELDTWRKNAVWASLLAGGAGVEFYIGEGKDLSVQDYRLYSDYWQTLRHAYDFFENNQLPISKMSPMDSLTSSGWSLARPGETYVVYLPEGGSTDLSLPEGNYTINWYDPRLGGALKKGSVSTVTGPGAMSLGNPPSDAAKDWVILVKKKAE